MHTDDTIERCGFNSMRKRFNGLHSPLMAPVESEAFVMYFNHLSKSGIYEPSCFVISTILTSKTVIVLVTNKSRFPVE